MKKKIALIMSAVMMLSTLLSTGVFAADETLETSAAIGIKYKTHIQDKGWESAWKQDGELSGTVGEWKRLEAVNIELTGSYPSDATIETYVHVQNYGDRGPFDMGQDAGTSGEGLRLESIEIVMDNVPGYTLAYNVQVQNIGWLRDENDTSTWFTSGQFAGTTGLGLRLEGIRIELLKVNEAYAAYLDVLDDVEEDDYTIDSWSVYQRLVKAYAVTEDDSEELIVLATETIQDAQKKLVKGMNLKKYKEALAKASEENYTPESWDVYAAIVAENIVSQVNTQEEIDQATKNILEGQKLLEPKVNLTEYLELLGSVRESDYTALSWFFYQQTVNGNQVGVKNTQTEVNTAVANIEAAKKKLVRKFDFTAYNALLDAVKEADYKTISWGKYQTVVNNNLVDENDTQSKIEEAILAIEEAQKALEKGSDLTGYNAVLNKVDKYACTTASWATYQKVVDANVVSKDSTQADVDAATEKILAAQLKLVGLGDLTDYKAALAKVKEEDYTTKSWETYQKVVLANVVTEASGQTAIDAATKKILDAQLKLLPSGDLTEYTALVTKNAATQGQWSVSSWTAYMKVVNANIMTTDNSQSQINSAIYKIKIAYAKLIEAGNIDAFTALLAKVNKADYTEASWTTYQKVVMANYMTTDNSQAEIDAAVKKITVAQLALVPKGNLADYLDLVYNGLGGKGEADYTTASWAEYQKVLAANAMSTNNSQDQIDAAMIIIKAAQGRLVAAADLYDYNYIINYYNNKRAQYTEESWAEYQTIVLDNLMTKDNTQTEVDNATIAIRNAAETLLKNATDLAEFKAVIALYESELASPGSVSGLVATTIPSTQMILDQDDYYDFTIQGTTWNDYKNAVTKYANFVGGVYDEATSPIRSGVTQADIDNATAIIKEARDNLYPADAAKATAFENYKKARNQKDLDRTLYTIPGLKLYDSALESNVLALPVIQLPADRIASYATPIQNAKDDLALKYLKASDDEWAAFTQEGSGAGNFYSTLSTDGNTYSGWDDYFKYHEEYYVSPLTKYTQASTPRSDVLIATKNMIRSRVALVLSTPTVPTPANVSVQLSSMPGVLEQTHTDGATTVPITTNLVLLTTAWLNSHNYGTAAGGAGITAALSADTTGNINVNNDSGVITVSDATKKYATVKLILTKGETSVETLVTVQIP
ncbi:MAG: hypothetical protein AB7D16_05855 [Eubacteriaceae bacterium]|nr:hypothetical protein [Eubacteriaceae bacterium]